MTAELVASEGAPGGLPGRLADQGYALPPALSFAEWEQAGITLRFIGRNVNWWIGDWMLYGERAYGEEAYQAALAGLTSLLGREADSLGQCAWVASRFPPGERVAGLSWSHHRQVLFDGLAGEDRRALLLTASARGWSVAELGDHAAARAEAVSAAPVSAASDPDGADVGEDVPEAPWQPTVEDLTPAARQALSYHAAQARVPERMAARIWVAALRWAEQRDAFTTWRE